MLDELLNLSDGLRSELYEQLRSIFPEDVIQGAILECDQYWFETARIDAYCQHFPFFARYFYDWPYDGRYPKFFQGLLSAFKLKLDFRFRPPEWDTHCKNMGYPEGSGPFIIRAILRASARAIKPQYIDTSQGIRVFEGLYPILFEYRPPCRALLGDRFKRSLGLNSLKRILGIRKQPAISVGQLNPRTAGTLGGLLSCRASGETFIASCAHVLGTTGTSSYRHGIFANRSRLGTVQFSKLASLKPNGAKCNPVAYPNAESLDVSITKLDEGIETLRGTGEVSSVQRVKPIREMQPYDQVHFRGQASGYVNGQLGGVVIWYQIEFNDGPRCFGRIFEIKSTPPRYIFHELARPGDSGAWIFSMLGEATEWNGMLIGCDGANAYACFAETILGECNSSFPGGLTPI
ncbi:MAG TPA: hypothetical protein VMJ32_11745 [Pirellulales bacterium]|nr:hypothetical protein [Pirellulales bacterium]